MTWERACIVGLIAANLVMWWRWPTNREQHVGCLVAIKACHHELEVAIRERLDHERKIVDLSLALSRASGERGKDHE